MGIATDVASANCGADGNIEGDGAAGEQQGGGGSNYTPDPQDTNVNGSGCDLAENGSSYVDSPGMTCYPYQLHGCYDVGVQGGGSYTCLVGVSDDVYGNWPDPDLMLWSYETHAATTTSVNSSSNMDYYPGVSTAYKESCLSYDFKKNWCSLATGGAPVINIDILGSGCDYDSNLGRYVDSVGATCEMTAMGCSWWSTYGDGSHACIAHAYGPNLNAYCAWNTATHAPKFDVNGNCLEIVP